MACNSKTIFISAEDQSLNAYTFADGVLEPRHKEHLKAAGTIKMMHATEELLYGVTFKGELIVFNANNLEEVVAKKDNPSKTGDVTAMAVSESTGTVWVADKKGFVHVLDAKTLEPVEVPSELKTKEKEGTYLVASNDQGSMIALGDAKGYVSVFDASARAFKFYHYANASKILCTQFNHDNTQI